MIWGKPLGPRKDHLPSPASFTRRTERIPPLEVHASPRGNQPTPLPSTVKHQTSMSVGWAKKNKLVPFLCTVSAGEHRHSSTHTHTLNYSSLLYMEKVGIQIPSKKENKNYLIFLFCLKHSHQQTSYYPRGELSC